jgi:hypothetical protein
MQIVRQNVDQVNIVFIEWVIYQFNLLQAVSVTSCSKYAIGTVVLIWSYVAAKGMSQLHAIRARFTLDKKLALLLFLTTNGVNGVVAIHHGVRGALEQTS